jgi:hypothetical protein
MYHDDEERPPQCVQAAIKMRDSEEVDDDEDKGLETHVCLEPQVYFFQYIYIIITLLTIATRLR